MGDLSGSTEPLKGKDVDGSNAGDDVEKQKPKTVSRALFDDQCFLKALTPTNLGYMYLIIFFARTSVAESMGQNLYYKRNANFLQPQ